MCNKDCVRKYRALHPWVMPRYYAMRRCNDPKHREYKGYGGRGIKFNLTMDEAKRLFERDHAWDLVKPSLDRLDPDGHYTFDNCRFIEHVANILDHRSPGSIDYEKEPVAAGDIQWEE